MARPCAGLFAWPLDVGEFMTRIVRPLLIAAITLSSSSSFAYGEFQSDIPNGASVGCVGCHERSGGGAPWNAFGDTLFTANGGTADDSGSVDAFDAGFIWWNAAICGADSDGDGQTNGQELGDPNCEWTSGAAARTSDISSPGNGQATSPNADGVDGGAAEGEGEGEGEGETDGAGGCGSAASPALLLPGLLLLRRRRQG